MDVVLFLGVVANLFFIVGSAFKEPSKTITFSIMGNFTYIVYYIVLGLTGPLINVAIGTLAGLIILKSNCPRRVKQVAIAAASIISLLIIWNFSVTIELYLLIATWCICCAQINKFNYIFYKLAVMMSQSLWIAYCISVGDYAMLATCALIISTNTISLVYNGVGQKYLSKFYCFFKVKST